MVYYFQYFYVVYYAAPVWIGSIQSTDWEHINIAHYRALRAVFGDHRKKQKRKNLEEKSGRAMPVQWARYFIASTAIKLYNTSDCHVA
jgi:hypothetical protein